MTKFLCSYLAHLKVLPVKKYTDVIKGVKKAYYTSKMVFLLSVATYIFGKMIQHSINTDLTVFAAKFNSKHYFLCCSKFYHNKQLCIMSKARSPKCGPIVV